MNAGDWGVHEGFWDVSGSWRAAPASTVEGILASMGAGEGPPPSPPVRTVRLDRPRPPVPAGRLHLEDGGEIEVAGDLPPDLPAGYHRLEERESGVSWSLIASPGRCLLPDRSEWGFAAQLYATRSSASWGMGDLGDLRRLVEWSSGLGAGLLVVNPLHATSPAGPQQPSPYFAGSRCFLNPIYVAVESVPGASELPGLERAAAAGRELNSTALIDRDRVWEVKSEALEGLFEVVRGAMPAAFDRFVAERGECLTLFSTYCALSEIHGPDWTEWPPELRDPHSAAVAAYASSAEGAGRVRYHSWLQWTADGQLREAAQSGRGWAGRAGAGIVQDLAVGVDRGGADGWMFQDAFSLGMEVGAPPDEFNTAGQNWGLPPFDPWRLREHAFAPWTESLRGSLRHAGGLRVDHVMGLFRLYWIPSGCAASEGAYVSYPHEEMLDILCLEASRAGAVVVGEDLGTVEDWVRSTLDERDILSYRVWWFEPGRPPTWPRKALGAVTTHDLPTVAGVLDGSDLDAQRDLGLAPNEESSEGLRRRLMEWTGSGEGDAPEEVVERAYADLATAPCVMLAAALDDVLAVSARPNMPGTVDEWPNWRLPLPATVEELEQHPLPRAVADRLRRRPP